MAQVAECLPSKCEAEFKPQYHQKKEGEEGGEEGREVGRKEGKES
jgi:hypothetical protein